MLTRTGFRKKIASVCCKTLQKNCFTQFIRENEEFRKFALVFHIITDNESKLLSDK